ncbi:YeeE/YedE family protein [Caproicibacter sp. BJN0012]|uniref:YeeE/YedE family protein n=1 Tax=Caproicibacter sp. BJN0012 TaxID=3110227 RepID=UPI002E10D4AC
MSKKEQVLGVVVLVLSLLLGKAFLKPGMLLRLVIGLALGYTLMRAYTGFAGSVNRAYRTGSTKLMRALMLMFFVSSVLTAAFLLNSDASEFSLWVNPINIGLMLGGVLFGFGMALSSCCATGVLTDLVVGLPRAFITLVFFGLGVYLGFPVQNTAGWVKNSWFTSASGGKFAGGVFLPDLFSWDGLNGYLGALVLTALLCGIVVYLSYRYEKSRKEKNTYVGNETEIMQEQPDPFDSKSYQLFSGVTFDRVFAKPWTLAQGAAVLSVLFAVLMGTTKAGWGASTPYGVWFGKLLLVFGVSPDAVAGFARMKPDSFVQPFFQNAVSVQNFGIILGTILYLLVAGVLVRTFREGLHITFREGLIFALGGLSMGFGTRLSNGCNVGALYTPIANFSLSGWIFLIFLVAGGVLGNLFGKAAFAKKKSGGLLG